MTVQSYIRGVGSFLPARVLTNEQLSQTVDTSDEWIRERTGITQRYIAAEGQNTSDLGLGAALDALANAKMDAAEIDGATCIKMLLTFKVFREVLTQ